MLSEASSIIRGCFFCFQIEPLCPNLCPFDYPDIFSCFAVAIFKSESLTMLYLSITDARHSPQSPGQDIMGLTNLCSCVSNGTIKGDRIGTLGSTGTERLCGISEHAGRGEQPAWPTQQQPRQFAPQRDRVARAAHSGSAVRPRVLPAHRDEMGNTGDGADPG